MKVAITSLNNTTDSAIDSRFGRCSWFIIYDTELKSTEFIPNPNIDSLEGAGIASAKLIASKGVEKVVSGEFGAKVKDVFDSLNIKLIIIRENNKTIQDIIKLLDKE
jgi:predicted Fe-Mo cluster-binding NifX family protein